MPSRDTRQTSAIRVVLVGTGTGVGKTHVACALLSAWAERARVVGLKPIETGVPVGGSTDVLMEASGGNARQHRRASGQALRGSGASLGGASHRPVRRSSASARAAETTDQERLARAALMFHVKQHDQAGPKSFHVKQMGRSRRARSSEGLLPPRQALFAFREPISPHLAAREAGVRIDAGVIERWVREHEAPITIIETAGGLFSPLGHGTTNFDLLRVVRPHAVILVASDRLGVLHDLTTTLALAEARGGPVLGVVLSAPAMRDASTGRNAAELAALGIACPIVVFPRAGERAPATLDAARAVIAWVEGIQGGRGIAGRL